MTGLVEETSGIPDGMTAAARKAAPPLPLDEDRGGDEDPRGLEPRTSTRGWFGKGLWAIFDQALSSGANFIPSVLLARWLSARDYGAFAIGMTLLFLAESLQCSLVLEPMLVFGRKYYRGRIDPYLQRVFLLQAIFSASCACGLAVAWAVSAFYDVDALEATFLALALVCPLTQFRVLMRHVSFLKLRYRLVAISGLVHLLLISAGLVGLSSSGRLSIGGAIAVMGVASLLGGTWLGGWLDFPPIVLAGGRLWRSVLVRHVRYARWSAGARVLVWFRASAPYLVLPMWAGLGASGAFRAMMNLIMPAMNVNAALPSLFIPILSRSRSESALNRRMARLLFVVTAPALVYWLVLSLAGPTILDLLYKGKYSQDASLLWMFGALPVILGCTIVFDCSFLIRERPKILFWASLLDSSLAYSVGILLIAWEGLAGAVLGTALASTVNVAILIGVHHWSPAQRGGGVSNRSRNS